MCTLEQKRKSVAEAGPLLHNEKATEKVAPVALFAREKGERERERARGGETDGRLDKKWANCNRSQATGNNTRPPAGQYNKQPADCCICCSLLLLSSISSFGRSLAPLQLLSGRRLFDRSLARSPAGRRHWANTLLFAPSCACKKTLASQANPRECTSSFGAKMAAP